MDPNPNVVPAHLVPGQEGENGWRGVTSGPADPVVVRTELADGTGVPQSREHLLSFLHLSDLHVMDAQSPARVEYLDRHSDPDSPLRERFPAVGSYRPHDMLSAHIVEAMVTALNHVVATRSDPVTFAVVTGDMTDNCQANELTAYLAILDGGPVTPNSGSPGRYEGVAASDPTTWDERYWHPGGPPAGVEPDLPTRLYGYPVVPGLLDAARRPFVATGLDVDWYAVYGNHDAMLQGTVVPDAALNALAVGDRRLTGLPPDADVAALLETLSGNGPATYPDPVTTPDSATAPSVPTTPDPARAFVDARGFVAAHLPRGGHGFGSANLRDGTTYWSADMPGGAGGPVRLVALDTVNPHGGWQGSVDHVQLTWLEAELRSVSSRWLDAGGQVRTNDVTDQLVIVASHHPSFCLTNPYTPDGSARALADDVVAVLLRFPNVVLWVDGHVHANHVAAHARPAGAGIGGGFWEVTTASHIDWPQQARVVDLHAVGDGLIAIGTSVVDHAGPASPPWSLDEPAGLAGLARALSMNDWQRRGTGFSDLMAGRPQDRTATLYVPSPFPLKG